MKLHKILSNLNSLEKNSFLKVIDNIISENPANKNLINKILLSHEGQIKNTDDGNVAKIFSLIDSEFRAYIESELSTSSSQLDILIDILIRDGNCIMSREWFGSLYEYEIKTLKKKIDNFKNILKNDNHADPERLRDYRIYYECLKTAYYNDEASNLQAKITFDERSILNTLSKNLEFSHEEIRLINYSVLPLNKQEIDDIINELKGLGIVFYHRKSFQVYIPDEVVTILRSLRGKIIADKHYRRVLTHLKESQINLIAKKHGIENKINKSLKIKEIIKNGISFTEVLKDSIYRTNTSQTDIKSFLNDLIFKELKIGSDNKGKTAEDKIDILTGYFESIDKEQKIGISFHGYDKLLKDLNSCLSKLNTTVKKEYELQNDFVLNGDLLLDYNILPRDILYLISDPDLVLFCEKFNIKTRGDIINNILEQYKDTESLFIENFEAIACRDFNTLKENDINLKEADLGIKFEELTKIIFRKLGLDIDEDLRKKLNNAKNKIDIVVNLGNNEIIIIECKSYKENGYNKYSSVSRQIKAYIDQAEKEGYRVIKSLLVAPEFSDDFEKECALEYDLNLSLISAASLKSIYTGFLDSKLKAFPYKLLLKDVLIKEDRILKAMAK